MKINLFYSFCFVSLLCGLTHSYAANNSASTSASAVTHTTSSTNPIHHPINCQSPKNTPEKIICQEANTYALYEQMSTLYQQQVQASTQAKTIQTVYQNGLATIHNSCKNAACFESFFQEQINWLALLDKQAESLQSWSGFYLRQAISNTNPAHIFVLVLQNNQLYITGHAQWQNNQQSPVQIGQLKGYSSISLPTSFTMQNTKQCIVKFEQLKNSALTITEQKLPDGQASVCGGINVKFNGTYFKQ